MNAARLARRLEDAKGDPLLMAEAIVDEVTDPAAGLVTRDYLDARLAEFEGRIERRFGEIERRVGALSWRIVGVATVQVAAIGLMIRFL